MSDERPDLSGLTERDSFDTATFAEDSQLLFARPTEDGERIMVHVKMSGRTIYKQIKGDEEFLEIELSAADIQNLHGLI